MFLLITPEHEDKFLQRVGELPEIQEMSSYHWREFSHLLKVRVRIDCCAPKHFQTRLKDYFPVSPGTHTAIASVVPKKKQVIFPYYQYPCHDKLL